MGSSRNGTRRIRTTPSQPHTLQLLTTLKGDIGAWCWFTSDKVRLLVNFIPRWLIIIVILALYARLYLIIYNAHNRFHSFDHPSGSIERSLERSLEPEIDSVSSTRRIGKPTMAFSSNSKGDSESGPDPEPTRGTTHTRGPNPVLKKMAYQMMMYPIIYMIIWTIPTAVRIYQAISGKPAPFGIATVDKVRALFPHRATFLERTLITNSGMHCHPRPCRRVSLRLQRSLAWRLAG
jgi:hypothetical protein